MDRAAPPGSVVGSPGGAMLFLDLETYSSVDLKKSNVYRYVEAEDFEILMCAWTTEPDVEPTLLVGETEILATLGPVLKDPDVVKVAHNAAFERVCLSHLLGLPVGTYLPPEEWVDPAILAAELGLPHSLEKAAEAAEVEAKDSAGTRLINLFSKPQPRTGKHLRAEDRPDQWQEFCDYCVQDVRVMVQLCRKLPRLSPSEHQAWLTDQRINDRGVVIDLAMAAAAEQAAEDNKMLHELEAISLTGLKNPNSVQQLTGWLTEQDIEVENLQAATVAKILAEPDLDPVVRRVLTLRQSMALTTSKKYGAALRSVNSDGRLRGMFRFHGAHTGRWTSGGVMLHNLARAGVEDSEARILDLKLGLGADDETLKALVRPLLTGPFTVVDYSAIEARVLAWLAGEEWVLDAFRAGRDIYVETAARLGPHFTRQQGKTAVLANGYGGSVGAMRRFGAEGTDEDLKEQVDAWRLANPNIVRFWNAVDRAMRFPASQAVGPCRFRRIRRSTLKVELPSGRALWYRKIRWFNEERDEDGEVVSRTKSNPSDKWARMAYADPKFGTSYAWFGTLVENITQAVARDVLAEALVRLNEAGYPVVAHVHDEVVVEGTDLDGVREIMERVPSWATGLPVTAEGFLASRYMKG